MFKHWKSGLAGAVAAATLAMPLTAAAELTGRGDCRQNGGRGFWRFGDGQTH